MRSVARLLAVISIALLLLLPTRLRAADNEAFTIPAGSSLHARLTSTLSTRSNEVGDPFTAEVTDPIFARGEEVIPAGSSIEGHVTMVQSPKRVKGNAELRLVADTVRTPDKHQYRIGAGLESADGPANAKLKDKEGTIEGPGKDNKRGAKEAGIGAGVGAGVGTIAGGGSGALYGAAIGAAAAVVHHLSKKHEDLVLPQGTELTFTFERAIEAQPATKNSDAPTQTEH